MVVEVDVVPVMMVEDRTDIFARIPETQLVAVLLPGEPAFHPHADLVLFKEPQDHLVEVRRATVPQILRVEVLVKVLPVTGDSQAFDSIGVTPTDGCCSFLDLLRTPVAWYIVTDQNMFQSRLASVLRKDTSRTARQVCVQTDLWVLRNWSGVRYLVRGEYKNTSMCSVSSHLFERICEGE